MKICVDPHNKSRQKSCAWCAATKSKCDLQVPSCGRCKARQNVCEYTQPVRAATRLNNPVRHFGPGTLLDSLSFAAQSHIDTSFFGNTQSSQEFSVTTDVTEITTAKSDPFTSSPLSSLSPAPLANRPTDNSFASMVAHFSDGGEHATHIENERHVCCPESWNRDRSFVPLLAEKLLSPLGKHSMRFTFRVLRTWPRMMVYIDRQMPPLFHHTQLEQESTSLANCYTIAKMWDGQQTKSSDLVAETTTREMTRIFQNVSDSSTKKLTTVV